MIPTLFTQQGLCGTNNIRAFLWTADGGMLDLNTLVDPLDPLSGSFRLARARDVNDLGQIVGEGVAANGEVHAFLLTPTILSADGTPKFGAAVNYLSGLSPKSSAAADFNGDGKLDLAIAITGDNKVAILIGNGDGTFQPPDTYQVGGFHRDGLAASVHAYWLPPNSSRGRRPMHLRHTQRGY